MEKTLGAGLINRLGELAVCLRISPEQAQRSGWSHETEILRLSTHGLGHLAGYDHELSETEETKAPQFESELLSLIGLGKIYSQPDVSG